MDCVQQKSQQLLSLQSFPIDSINQSVLADGVMKSLFGCSFTKLVFRNLNRVRYSRDVFKCGTAFQDVDKAKPQIPSGQRCTETQLNHTLPKAYPQYKELRPKTV